MQAGSLGIQGDLLGRLAQGRGHDVGVVGLGLAAREAHLAAVVAVAARALGQHHPGQAVGVREEQHEHRGRPPRLAARRRPGQATRRAADDDRHQHGGRLGQGCRQDRQAPDGVVEPHRPVPAVS